MSCPTVLPTSSQATDTYVAIGSLDEVEVLDAATGAIIGSPIEVGDDPVAFAESYPDDTEETSIFVVNEGSDDISVISVESGSVTATISLPSGEVPVAIAHDPDEPYALVASSTGEVSVIDVQNDTYIGNVSSLPSGFTPNSVAFSPAGLAYVTSASTNEVAILAYTTSSPYFSLSSTYTGDSSFEPEDIVVSSDGSTAYVSDAGGSGEIDFFDVSSGAFSYESSSALDYTPGDLALSYNGGSLYVALPGTKHVAYVDTATGSVSISPIAVTTGPLGAQDYNGVMMVGNSDGDDLERISTATREEIGTVSLAGEATAIFPSVEVALRYFAYVTNATSDTMQVLDLSADDSRLTVGVGDDPDAVAVSPDGSMVYVANSGSSTVTAVSTDSIDDSGGASTETISLASGAEPVALAVTPDGNHLLAVDEATGEIDVIDTNPADSSYLTQVATIYLDGSGTADPSLSPDAIAMSPAGNYAYVLDQGDDAISVLSLSSTDTYSSSAPETGLSLVDPRDLAVSPDGADVFVTDNAAEGYLRAYSISPSNGSLELVSSVEVGTDPSSLSLSPEGSSAYVANAGSSSVSLVDLADAASMSVTSTTSVPGEPVAVATTPDGTEYAEASDTGCGSGGNSVSLYNASSSDLVATISTGTKPSAIAISPTLDTPQSGTVDAPELTGGADNPSIAAVSSEGDDVIEGVDTATGAYTTSVTDFELPDIGIGLDISETYDSSLSGEDGPLGYGWAFSYGMSLSQNSPEATADPCQITVSQENGSVIAFSPTTSFTTSCPTAGYEAPTFVQASISLVTCGSSSCWELTRDDTSEFLLSKSTGELLDESDRDGNTVSLTYEDGELETVTAPSGERSLGFSWSSGKITEVSDSAGAAASFTYDSAGDLEEISLTAPADPLSHDYYFSYNSSNELVDSFSPDEAADYPSETTGATEVAYDGGVVTSVTEPEVPSQCDGEPGTPYCSPETSFSYPSYNYDTMTGTVLVDDADTNAGLSYGVVTLDTYIDGLLRSETKGYGPGEDATSMTIEIREPYTLMPVESLDGDGGLTIASYDANAEVLTSTDPMGYETSYDYNSFGEVTETTDPMGYVTSATYDDDGNELTSTDADGNVTSYAYNANGLRCAMLNPDGYAAGDRLTSCPSGPEPYETLYGYDAEGDETSVTVYDGTGNTVTETYVTTSLFNSAGEVCASLSADGYAAGYSLPASCPTTGAPYETLDTAYDVFGDLLESISPTNAPGGTTTNTYDADGNEISSTDPSDETTTTTYSPDGEVCWTEPQAVSDATCSSPPTGSSTETTSDYYDADGNEISTTSPDGNADPSLSCLYTTSNSYDDLGDTLSVTTPVGGTSCSNEETSTTTNTYDADGNEISSTDGSESVTTNAYNADGELCWSDVAAVTNPTCSSPPTGSGTETTTYTYNEDGEETETVPPDGNASSDPSEYATTDTYDEDGNLTSETVPPPSGSGAGETTTYYYDADANELAVTGPNGDPDTCDPLTTSDCTDTTYDVYDEDNRELSTTNPSGDETTYTYDADGTMLTETENSSTGTYSYNGAGQVTEISYTDGTPTVTYQYNSAGEVCWMYQGTSTNSCSSPPTGAVTYDYDSEGQLVSETNAAGATDTYSYDSSGNLTCVSYPNGSGNTCSDKGNGIVNYLYNGDDQLSSLEVDDNGEDTLDFAYNSSGQLCWVSSGQSSEPSCDEPPSLGVTTSYTYNSSGAVTNIETGPGSLGQSPMLEFSATRDPDGNITSETPTVNGRTLATDDYSYNDEDEVASGPIDSPSGNSDYAYLPTGSITEDTTAFQSAAYTDSGEICWTYAGSSSNGCSSPPADSTTYSYNASGERTGMTPSGPAPESYGWETESGRLVCVNTAGTSCSTSEPTTTTTVYTYDGNGLRTSATTQSPGTASATFTWGTIDGSPTLLSDGTWDYIYVPGDSTPIEQIQADTGPSGPLYMLLSDESGSVRGIVDLSDLLPELVNYTDYDAYGNPITESGGPPESGGISVPQPGYLESIPTPWGFGGGYMSAGGLLYFANGYYDPTTGQFLSVQSNQTYVYDNDNPLAVTISGAGGGGSASPDASGAGAQGIGSELPGGSGFALPAGGSPPPAGSGDTGSGSGSSSPPVNPEGLEVTTCVPATALSDLPAGCELWASSYEALSELHVSVTSPKFVSWHGAEVYGPLYDLLEAKRDSSDFFSYIVYGMHLLQANRYHWESYDDWFSSGLTGNVYTLISLCAAEDVDTSECFPTPDLVGSTPDIDEGIRYMATMYQDAGTPTPTTAEIKAINDMADATEWVGDGIIDLIGQ